jgi:Cu/Ag efflux pump CusA
MSLTGIALAIGVVVDDGIVMVENAIEVFLKDKKKWILINNRTMKIYLKDIQKEQDPLSSEERMKLIEDSSKLVGVLLNINCYCFFFYPFFIDRNGRKTI